MSIVSIEQFNDIYLKTTISYIEKGQFFLHGKKLMRAIDSEGYYCLDNATVIKTIGGFVYPVEVLKPPHFVANALKEMKVKVFTTGTVFLYDSSFYQKLDYTNVYNITQNTVEKLRGDTYVKLANQVAALEFRKVLKNES